MHSLPDNGTGIKMYSKMIWHFQPYSLTKNLGWAYNQYMQLIPDDDSACFTDGDVMHLLPDFGTIIHNYAERYPDAVLTAKTNRIHHLSKQLDGVMDEECNVRDLMMKAYSRKHLTTVTEVMPGEGFSGMLMVVPKKVWKKVPFVENGGCLGVDSAFRIALHQAGIKTLIMDGLFVFHSYRLLNGVSYKSHLI